MGDARISREFENGGRGDGGRPRPSPDMHVIVSIAGWRVIWAFGEWEKLLGRPASDLEGLSLRDLVPEPEADGFFEALITGSPSLEHTARCLDGSGRLRSLAWRCRMTDDRRRMILAARVLGKTPEAGPDVQPRAEAG